MSEFTGKESSITIKNYSFLEPARVKAWLGVEKYILDSFPSPSTKSDSRIHAWMAVAKHPVFADCYHQTEGTLLDAVLAKLNDVHAHTCEPVWRPTTRDEIQPGWEVRSRHRNGSEATWGIAHYQDGDGDWFTEAGVVLTYDAGWTYETTAPLPEPWDEAMVGVVSDALAGTEDPGPHWDDDARRVLDALAARGYLERAAITGGEQS